MYGSIQSRSSLRAWLRHIACLLSILLPIGLSGCVSAAQIGDGNDQALAGRAVHKVLVVDVQRNPAQRRLWEDCMVEALRRQRIAAIPSYQIFPTQAPTPVELAAVIRPLGVDRVLATHGVHTNWSDGPGDDGSGSDWLRRYFSYWIVAHRPGSGGYYQTDFRTDVFAVAAKGGRLIGGSVTHGVDLSSKRATTDAISQGLVTDLIRKGLLSAG